MTIVPGTLSQSPFPRRVVLIIPPSSFLLDERVFPFVGILKVASSLEAAGVSVDMIDLSGIKNFAEIAAMHANRIPAAYFGLTATTPQFPAAVQIVEAIRAARPDARFILGGTHATLTVAARKYEEEQGRIGRAHAAYAQLEKNFDVIVSGDGEDAIFLALQDDAPRLIDGDFRKSPLFLTNKRLDATAFPARHLIDLLSYQYTVDGAPATSLIAQLGCPYKCGFCAGRASPMLRNIRMRSDESVLEEMRQLYQTYGYTGFMFYDDELNVNPGMLGLMEKIVRLQRDLGTTWKLRGFIKSERFNDDQARVMHEAGFRQILVGFESGSPRILENIQKIATQDDNTRCMDIARRAGLKVKALMSLGHPGESKKTVRDTCKWLIDNEPSDFDATIITPYPGSPYYDQAVQVDGRPVWVYVAKNGDRLYQEEVNYAEKADFYKGDPNDGYISHVWTDTLEQRELVAERDQLERFVREKLSIPFNPSRAARLIERSMGMSPSVYRTSRPVEQ